MERGVRKTMRAVFMGTPQIAAVILERLIADAKTEIVGVVTQTDKPKGRGKEVAYSEVKETALRYSIPVYQPEKIKDAAFFEQLKQLEPDIILVAAYGKKLPDYLLQLPPYGCINVHASLLPKYRGAAPIQWCVIHGEEVTGITIMYMAEGIDTGDIILKKEYRLEKKETAGSLYDKLAELGAAALLEALPLLESKTALRIPQDSSMATVAPMLTKTSGLLDFSKTAKELECFIRGLNPWPSAYTEYKGKILKFWEADVCTDPVKIADAFKKESGSVVFSDKEGFGIACKDSVLLVKSVQLEGKKRMSAAEFLRGNPLEAGWKFHVLAHI